MKVVIVTASFYPNIGGSEISMYSLTRYLQALQFEITIVTHQQVTPAFSYQNLNVLRTSFGNLTYVLDNLHHKNRIDLIFTMMLFGKQTLSWAVNNDIPTLYFVSNTAIDLTFLHNDEFRPTHIIVNSKFTQSFVRSKYRLNSHVIHPIIHLNRTKSTNNGNLISMINPIQLKGSNLFKRIAINLPNHSFSVIESWTGLKDKYGNWDQKIWELYRREYNNPSLHPPEETSFKGMQNVKKFNSTPHIDSFYNKTKILLFPSQCEETFGRGVVEALQRGIPVIASKIGGIPETGLQNGGFLLNKNTDLLEWITKIKQILHNYTEYVNKARKDGQNYSAICQIMKLLDLLECPVPTKDTIKNQINNAIF